jgi:hypothetical protein
MSKPTTLDEILDTLLWVDGIRHKNHAQAKQDILDLFESKVIGEDEPPAGLTSYYPGIERNSTLREGRNELRYTQRQALKEIGDK